MDGQNNPRGGGNNFISRCESCRGVPNKPANHPDNFLRGKNNFFRSARALACNRQRLVVGLSKQFRREARRIAAEAAALPKTTKCSTPKNLWLNPTSFPPTSRENSNGSITSPPNFPLMPPLSASRRRRSRRRRRMMRISPSWSARKTSTRRRRAIGRPIKMRCAAAQPSARCRRRLRSACPDGGSGGNFQPRLGAGRAHQETSGLHGSHRAGFGHHRRGTNG